MAKGFVYGHVGTVAGSEMTLVAGKLGGFMLNGSAGSATLSLLDGAVLLIKTSAGADQVIQRVYEAPIACTTSILATCSGTGYYRVFIST